MVFGGRFLIVELFMPSWSGDLFFFSFLITERTSPGDVGVADNATGRGDEMNSSTRSRCGVSGEMLWGLNVLAKWIAKSSDFS